MDIDMGMDMDTERDRLAKARDKQEKSWASMSITIRILGIMILPVSNIGALVCIWGIEKLADRHHDISLLVEAALTSFVLGVIASLFSQIFAYMANQNGYLMSQAETDQKRESEIAAYSSKVAKYAAYAEKWGYLSLACPIGGSILAWSAIIFNSQSSLY